VGEDKGKGRKRGRKEGGGEKKRGVPVRPEHDIKFFLTEIVSRSTREISPSSLSLENVYDV